MKVLHISRTMGQGGAEKVVYQLCRDCRIDSVVASSGGRYVDALKKNGTKHYKLIDITNKNPFVFLRNLRELYRIVEQEKITIVHSHHRMAALYAKFLKKKYKNLSLVYTAHNSFHDKRGLLKYALKNTKIVACGKSVENNLVEYYGFPREEITIITNSVEIPKDLKPASLGGGEKKFNVGIIGRLTEQKGIDVFIKAFSKLDGNVHGFIVGDGELRGWLERLTQELNLTDKITFLGYREDTLSIIKALDLVVSASRWEGFPLVPIEAFGCGKTIVASDTAGNTDIVVDGYNGLLFPANDIYALSEKINKICSDKSLKNYLEKMSMIDFRDKYSYNIFIGNYKKVYSGFEDGN